MKIREIKKRLTKLPSWAYDSRKKAIWTEVVCKDFMAAVGLINKIAKLAEKADHHPDLVLTRYKRLKIVLTTHSEGGVTVKDLRMAKALGRRPKGRY